MTKTEFESVKKPYEQAREMERIALADHLAAHQDVAAKGLQVVTGSGAGRGSEHYSSNGKIPVFNLCNWKWVEVTSKDGFTCVISLNMPDIAPRTGTPVALYDRIGLICLPSPREWIYTDIDLPLDGTTRERIALLVLEQYKAYCDKQKEG